MQEVTATATSTGTSFDQLRTSAVVEVSSQARAFSDFMNLAASAPANSWTAFTSSATGTAASPAVSPVASTAASPAVTTAASAAVNTAAGTAASSGNNAAATSNSAAASTAATGTNVGTGVQALLSQINATPDVAPAQPLVQSDTASTLATTGTTQASASTFRTASTKDTSQSAAKNTTVSRQSFEESKPLLLKAGLSDKEIADLSKRVQAGTLTWGQLVQTIGAHTTGATKSVSLSADDAANLQSMFQKLGFTSEDAAGMVTSVGKGEGLKVLSAIQSKLAGTDSGTTPSLTSGELSTFFKALNLPGTTADALTQKLAGDKATVADITSALTTIGQTMQEQRAKSSANDTEVAKGLANIMAKDVAKNARDTTGTTTATGSSGGQVAYDLKTKDPNDMSWFNEHEQNQQKASDDAWRNFTNKVRTDDSGTRQSAAETAAAKSASAASASASTSTSSSNSTSAHAATQATTATKSDSLDAALARAGQSIATPQGKAQTTQQTTAFEKVVAPKMLDQVTQAMLKDLGQGRRQLTVELTPENLGKVQVMLQVKGKEVSAVISAEDSSTAAMLHSNMEGLRKSLEDKGLTVQNMQVQTGLASRQDQQASFNAEQHNQQAQEQQDMSRIFSQMRMMRSDTGSGAMDIQNANMQAILADQGLHLIA